MGSHDDEIPWGEEDTLLVYRGSSKPKYSPKMKILTFTSSSPKNIRIVTVKHGRSVFDMEPPVEKLILPERPSVW